MHLENGNTVSLDKTLCEFRADIHDKSKKNHKHLRHKISKYTPWLTTHRLFKNASVFRDSEIMRLDRDGGIAPRMADGTLGGRRLRRRVSGGLSAENISEQLHRI